MSVTHLKRIAPVAAGLAAALPGAWWLRHIMARAVRVWRPGHGKFVRGGKLSARVAGSGDRTFLLLHGLVSSGETFGSAYDYAELVREGLAAAAAHGGAVFDATFSSRVRRDFLRTQCAEANTRLQIVELVADDTQIATRLKLREKSNGEISDARLGDFEKLSAAYERPSEVAAELIQISASGKVSKAVEKVLLHLASQQSAAEQGGNTHG